MIYPRTQIAKRWYRVSESAKNVLEIYTGKPLGVETTCDGFDMRDIITKGGVDYYNPKYGKRLANADMIKLFPYVEVQYNTTKVEDDSTLNKIKSKTEAIHPYTGKTLVVADDDNVTYNTEKKNVYVKIFPQRTDGLENSTESYDEQCLPVYEWVSDGDADLRKITEYLWLDNMVEEGDTVTEVTGLKNGINGFTDTIDSYHSFTNIDTTKESSADSVSYAQEFTDGLVDILMDGLDSGLSFTDAYNRLPWYVTGSRKNNDGSVDTVTSCKCKSKKGTTASDKNIMTTFALDANGKPNTTLLTLIIAKLNAKAQNCVEDIYQNIVVKSGLNTSITKSNVPPFKKVTSSSNAPEIGGEEEPEVPGEGENNGDNNG